MTSLVQGILHTRNVNLARIAASDKIDDGSEAIESSKYRRFQRFFSDFEMPLDDLSRLIRRKIPKPPEGYVLSMDRTNWKFGKKTYQCPDSWNQCGISLHPVGVEGSSADHEER